MEGGPPGEPTRRVGGCGPARSWGLIADRFGELQVSLCCLYLSVGSSGRLELSNVSAHASFTRSELLSDSSERHRLARVRCLDITMGRCQGCGSISLPMLFT